MANANSHLSSTIRFQGVPTWALEAAIEAAPMVSLSTDAVSDPVKRNDLDGMIAEVSRRNTPDHGRPVSKRFGDMVKAHDWLKANGYKTVGTGTVWLKETVSSNSRGGQSSDAFVALCRYRAPAYTVFITKAFQEE